jgi:hypothetical protein
LDKGYWSFSVQEDGITVTSGTAFLHPSTFNPKDNQTALPAVYLISRALAEHGLGDNVKNITWGDKNKQNSSPRVGLIEGNFVGLTVDQLRSYMQEIKITLHQPELSLFKLDKNKTILTSGVITVSDYVVEGIVDQLGHEVGHQVVTTTMDYMTDIGALFNLLKERNFSRVYGLIYGVGDPDCLHQVESLSSQNVIEVYRAMKQLLNIVQGQLMG